MIIIVVISVELIVLTAVFATCPIACLPDCLDFAMVTAIFIISVVPFDAIVAVCVVGKTAKFVFAVNHVVTVSEVGTALFVSVSDVFVVDVVVLFVVVGVFSF